MHLFLRSIPEDQASGLSGGKWRDRHQGKGVFRDIREMMFCLFFRSKRPSLTCSGFRDFQDDLGSWKPIRMCAIFTSGGVFTNSNVGWLLCLDDVDRDQVAWTRNCYTRTWARMKSIEIMMVHHAKKNVKPDTSVDMGRSNWPWKPLKNCLFFDQRSIIFN